MAASSSSLTTSRKRSISDAATLNKAPRTVARRPLLLELPTDLLDNVLVCLWPDAPDALVRACGTCKHMRRLASVGALLLDRLDLHGDHIGELTPRKLSILVEQMPKGQQAMDRVMEPSPAVTEMERARALADLKLLSPLIIGLHAPKLLPLLQAASANMRTNVLNALRPLGPTWNGKHASKLLVLRLSDDNIWARFATLKTLNMFDGPVIAPHASALALQLMASGDDFDPFACRLVRNMALECLRRMGIAALAAVAEVMPMMIVHDDRTVVEFAERVQVAFSLKPANCEAIHVA